MLVINIHLTPTRLYSLSLHDALPILEITCPGEMEVTRVSGRNTRRLPATSTTKPTARAGPRSWGSTTTSRTLATTDRKSTRLNSSHVAISYAVFCLKKKKNIQTIVQH